MSADIKLSKAQISEIIQSRGLKVAGPFAKNVLPPLSSTAAMSAIDAGIQKKIYSSGRTTLIISNEEMNDNENCSSFRGFKYVIERSY